ncbi:MAG: hypothetical protein JOY71_14230 [Acetobacteraceae bacterium]|nr:hypothetical protein [Acetobacteraceae bacterium]
MGRPIALRPAAAGAAASEDGVAEQLLHKLLITAEVGWNPWSIHGLPPFI